MQILLGILGALNRYIYWQWHCVKPLFCTSVHGTWVRRLTDCSISAWVWFYSHCSENCQNAATVFFCLAEKCNNMAWRRIWLKPQTKFNIGTFIISLPRRKHKAKKTSWFSKKVGSLVFSYIVFPVNTCYRSVVKSM